MNKAINFKNKKNIYKLIFSIILVLIVWLFLRPKTPQEQTIAKYIKETNSNSYTLTMIVRESKNIDPMYGRLYYVNGVIGGYADVNFFYLNHLLHSVAFRIPNRMILLDKSPDTVVILDYKKPN
jgi:hypothetical protein